MVLLVIIVRHYAQEGSIGNINRSVYHHHQKIHGVGIDALACRAKVWGVQKQGKDQPKRDGPKD